MGKKCQAFTSHKRELIAIGLMVAVKLLYSLWFYDWTGESFFALSYDDISRTLISLDWSRGLNTIVLGGVWLPLQFWVVGSIMRVWADVLHVPMAVNLLFSLLSLVALYYLASDLFGPSTAFLSGLLTVLVPWHLWLSLSGLPNSIFQFFVVLSFWGFLRWWTTQNTRHLQLAALSMSIAGMLRFEGWMFSFVLVAILLVKWGLVRDARTRDIALAVFILLLFPIAYCAASCFYRGDCLYFVGVNRRALARVGSAGLWDRIARYPQELVRISPSLLMLSVAGLVQSVKDRTPGLVPFLGLWVGELTLLVVGSAGGTGGTSLPARFVVASFIVLVPFASYVIVKLWRGSGKTRWVAAGLLCVVLGANVAGGFADRPHIPEPVVQAGDLTGKLWTSGFLDPEDSVLLELRLWDFLAFQLLSERPAQVLLDRPLQNVQGILEPDQQSELLDYADDAAALARYLKLRGVRVVIGLSDEVVACAASVMSPVEQVGQYHFLVFPEDQAGYQVTVHRDD